MMKKRIGLLVFAMLFVFTGAVQAAPAKAPAQIRVFLDGKEIKFQAAPVIKNGVTFVQFRPLFQSLGYTVNWNNTTKQVTGTFADQKLQMKLGSTIAYVNGQKTKLAIAPYTQAGNTLVPLRFVAESTGLPVKWDAKARTIKIDRKTITNQVSLEVKKLYKDQAAAETKGDYKQAMTAIHPKAPGYKEYENNYKEQAGYQHKVSMSVYDVTVAGSSVLATVEKSYQRTGGPFMWDFTAYFDVILKKDATGKWKEYSNELFDFEFNFSDELLESTPEVPATEKTVLINTMDTQYKGFNEQNAELLHSIAYPNSPFDDLIKAGVDDGMLDDPNFKVTADSMSIVLYQNNDAVIYVEETNEYKGEVVYNSSNLYWLKKKNNQWLIYDQLDITE